MIRSFKTSATEKIFKRCHSKKIPDDIQQIAFRKLRMINRSENINDLRVPPANHLEKLKGERIGQYSIRINDQWRICFRYEDGDVFDVEIVDYHRG